MLMEKCKIVIKSLQNIRNKNRIKTHRKKYKQVLNLREQNVAEERQRTLGSGGIFFYLQT